LRQIYRADVCALKKQNESDSNPPGSDRVGF